jgi:hypothetical protein
MTSVKASRAIKRLATKAMPSKNVAIQVPKAARAKEASVSTTNQSTPFATANLTSKEAEVKEEYFGNSPATLTAFVNTPTQCPIGPDGWDDRMLANLLSAWDSGTHDLEMLKRRLDLAYSLDARSYSIDFLQWVLIRHGRANSIIVDPFGDWASDDDPEGAREFQVLMLEAKKGPVEETQFL